MGRVGGVLAVIVAVLGWMVAPGTAIAEVEPVVRFHGVQYDSPGADNRSPESLNQEWISVVNTGRKSVSLLRWTVRDEAGRVFTFGNVVVPGNGAKVRVHSGKGRATATDLFWGSGNYVWKNTGDEALLRDAAGRGVDDCAWSQRKGRAWVAC